MDKGWAVSFQSVWYTKEKRENFTMDKQQILSQQIKYNNSDITLKLRI